MKKRKVILLILIAFVVAVLAASFCFSVFWSDFYHKEYLYLRENLSGSMAIYYADRYSKTLAMFVSFTILQALALVSSICVLIHIIKTDFTLSKQEREKRENQIAEQKKQAKREKLQAQLDELNKE